MENHHDHAHYHIHSNELRTRIVLILMIFTFLLQLFFGYMANSVTLIADGWHMLSHVMVLGISWASYYILRSKEGQLSAVEKNRVLALGGFASSIILFFVTAHVISESVQGWFDSAIHVHPPVLLTAFIGLIINGISAFVLHQEESGQDVNIRGAFYHVLSDVVISLLALISLSFSYFFGIDSLDPLLGFTGALILLYWALVLAKRSVQSLLHVK
jgi:cobalt-zinc-cadmium efflux system protein